MGATTFGQANTGVLPSTLTRLATDWHFDEMISALSDLEVAASAIAYLSLDMNWAVPEQRAAEYFWDRIVPGGIILHDDYGFKLHEEQRKMMDRFAASRGVQVLALPTGQGIILKPS